MGTWLAFQVFTFAVSTDRTQIMDRDCRYLLQCLSASLFATDHSLVVRVDPGCPCGICTKDTPGCHLWDSCRHDGMSALTACEQQHVRTGQFLFLNDKCRFVHALVPVEWAMPFNSNTFPCSGRVSNHCSDAGIPACFSKRFKTSLDHPIDARELSKLHESIGSEAVDSSGNALHSSTRNIRQCMNTTQRLL